MNVLLTHGYFLNDDAKERAIMRPYPPLGILYISAYLEQHRIDHEIFDTTFSTKADLKKHLLDKRPGVIGLYVNLMTKVNVLEIILFLKDNIQPCQIILGGPEVRHHAENFLRHGADYVVMGEGEESMMELIQSISGTPSSNVTTIRGIAFLKHGEFIQTEEREKIKDLDQLPLPNRKKINLHLYLDAWKNFHGSNAISVSTMRGCPYTCKWCSRAVYGLSYRRRSPEKVVEELISIQNEYHPDALWFVDDVFTISHKWLTGFQQELNMKSLRIPYECITRADRLNEEVIRILKDTGCFRVWIGAESGSQRVIDLMDRRVNVVQVREMIKMSKKYGIEAGTFIMLGYPGETEADIEETIRHLKDSDPDYFTITLAYPIKGTELYQEVESLQTNVLDWQHSSDRQIDFIRAYPRKYYDFAIQHVVNEVNYHKSKNGKPSLKRVKLKINSLRAKAGMHWHRRRSVNG